MIIQLAKCLHDVINEVCANDNKTNDNLNLLQRQLHDWICDRESEPT